MIHLPYLGDFLCYCQHVQICLSTFETLFFTNPSKAPVLLINFQNSSTSVKTGVQLFRWSGRTRCVNGDRRSSLQQKQVRNWRLYVCGRLRLVFDILLKSLPVAIRRTLPSSQHQNEELFCSQVFTRSLPSIIIAKSVPFVFWKH